MSIIIAAYMTKEPLAVALDTPLSDVIQLMHDQDVRHVPVVVDGALIGIVSDRDIRSALRGAAERTVLETRMDLGTLNGIAASRVMTRDPISLTPETPVLDAVEIMIEDKISALPVVAGDQRGTLVGIVTSWDLLGLVRELLERT